MLNYLMGSWVQISAYVLIQTAPGKPWTVLEELRKIEGVKAVHTVTGVYDLIAFVEAADLKALGELVKKIHGVEGVQRTQTAICVE